MEKCICNTASPEKSSVRDNVLSTRQLSALLIGGMTLIILLAISSGCLPKPHSSTQHEPVALPVVRKVVQIRFNLYKTQKEVTAACNMKRDGRLIPVQGCTTASNRGTATVHSLMPANWWDVNRLETLGHETMHAMYFWHRDGFKAPWVQNPPIPDHVDAEIVDVLP